MTCSGRTLSVVECVRLLRVIVNEGNESNDEKVALVYWVSGNYCYINSDNDFTHTIIVILAISLPKEGFFYPIILRVILSLAFINGADSC